MQTTLTCSKKTQACKHLLSVFTASFRDEVRSADDNALVSRTSKISEKSSVDVFFFSCSALSLDHDTSLSSRGHTFSTSSAAVKKEVEIHAASLLSRPVTFNKKRNEVKDSNGNVTHPESPFSFVSTKLLHNLYASTMVLIQCRLRNYLIFLARHGISLAQTGGTNENGVLGIEQKLLRLLEIGQQIAPRRMSLNIIQSDDDGDYEQLIEDEDDCSASKECSGTHYDLSYRTSCCLQASMELYLDKSCNEETEHETINVKFEAPGCLQAEFHPTGEDQSFVMKSLDINFNTSTLLNGMIQQASKVVAAVVQKANTASIVPEFRLPRSASFLAMAPLDCHNVDSSQFSAISTSDGEDIDYDVAKVGIAFDGTQEGGDVLAVSCNIEVSEMADASNFAHQTSENVLPDIFKPANVPALASAPSSLTSYIEMGCDDKCCGEFWTFPTLSPDECENIVDEVFGGLETSILQCRDSKLRQTSLSSSLPPPCKKRKLVDTVVLL